MGATTTLYYLAKHYLKDYSENNVKIGAVVVDSPFSNLYKLMAELASQKIKLP